MSAYVRQPGRPIARERDIKRGRGGLARRRHGLPVRRRVCACRWRGIPHIASSRYQWGRDQGIVALGKLPAAKRIFSTLYIASQPFAGPSASGLPLCQQRNPTPARAGRHRYSATLACPDSRPSPASPRARPGALAVAASCRTGCRASRSSAPQQKIHDDDDDQEADEADAAAIGGTVIAVAVVAAATENDDQDDDEEDDRQRHR